MCGRHDIGGVAEVDEEGVGDGEKGARGRPGGRGGEAWERGGVREERAVEVLEDGEGGGGGGVLETDGNVLGAVRSVCESGRLVWRS